MGVGLKLSCFSKATEQDRYDAVAELSRAALEPDAVYVNQQLQEINERIKKLECRYEMSSDLMKSCLGRGEIKETSDICSWILLLKVKDNLVSNSTTSWA
jgi:hypothetical protein